MTPIIDIHTHRPDADGALISVDPRDFDPQPGKWYSVGFHPWHDVGLLTPEDFDLLERCVCHPQVLAIGETGIDHLRGDAVPIQANAFVRHLRLAHELNKPVVAHCVKAAQDILAARHNAGYDDVPPAACPSGHASIPPLFRPPHPTDCSSRPMTRPMSPSMMWPPASAKSCP